MANNNSPTNIGPPTEEREKNNGSQPKVLCDEGVGEDQPAPVNRRASTVRTEAGIGTLQKKTEGKKILYKILRG